MNMKYAFKPGHLFVLLMLIGCGGGNSSRSTQLTLLKGIERQRVLTAVDAYLKQEPLTIVASLCERSAGGLHDFYSEGDYWWPDPEHPHGPYIRRDGMSNPENFQDHRRALVRFGIQVPALTSAYVITGDLKYAQHAARHLRAWFIDPKTRMNPNLNYAQAISGLVTGRGVGIIDTIHLVEVALAFNHLQAAQVLTRQEQDLIRQWFADYLQWLTTHEYGLDEMNRLNNHGTCWILQVAAFSTVTGNDSLQTFCRNRFEQVLLPYQLAADGSFPKELERTKPYGYALFNLDVMAGVLQLLSTTQENLWEFKVANGAGYLKAMEYMAPYIADKGSWPLDPDVMYWEEWPVRHPSLYFAGTAYNRPEWIRLWEGLDPDPTVEEVIRNFPIRQPLLWLNP